MHSKSEWRVDFFNKFAEFYDFTRFFLTNTKITVDNIRRFLPERKVGLMVDVGGGSGIISREFRGNARKLVVLDPSERMIRRARSRGLSAVRAFAEETGLKNKSVDAIIMIDSFHHFRDHEKALLEMSRILKDNGVIVVEEIRPDSFPGRFLFSLEWALGCGSRFFAPDELQGLFDDSGFKSETVKVGFRYYLRAGKWRK
ncbi:class I SAM-dependent methyltransferase [Candidatus Woesearchaeota archaeon]|nr:class I SAM-dependent methyltransferase [Candidatus Woesearchaeota archaeon]